MNTSEKKGRQDRERPDGVSIQGGICDGGLSKSVRTIDQAERLGRGRCISHHTSHTDPCEPARVGLVSDRVWFGLRYGPDAPYEKEQQLSDVERNAIDPSGANACDPVQEWKAENNDCPKGHRDLR